jgi:hypothetical protein
MWGRSLFCWGSQVHFNLCGFRGVGVLEGRDFDNPRRQPGVGIVLSFSPNGALLIPVCGKSWCYAPLGLGSGGAAGPRLTPGVIRVWPLRGLGFCDAARRNRGCTETVTPSDSPLASHLPQEEGLGWPPSVREVARGEGRVTEGVGAESGRDGAENGREITFVGFVAAATPSVSPSASHLPQEEGLACDAARRNRGCGDRGVCQKKGGF